MAETAILPDFLNCGARSYFRASVPGTGRLFFLTLFSPSLLLNFFLCFLHFILTYSDPPLTHLCTIWVVFPFSSSSFVVPLPLCLFLVSGGSCIWQIYPKFASVTTKEMEAGEEAGRNFCAHIIEVKDHISHNGYLCQAALVLLERKVEG